MMVLNSAPWNITYKLSVPFFALKTISCPT